MKNLRRILFVLLSLIAFSPSICQAQEQPLTDEMPNFEKIFEVLEKNRVTYNQYNDSIFIIKDHDQWVNFFRRRALKNHQLFAANQELLRTVYDYFEKNEGNVPESAYVALYYGMDKLNNDETADPFIAKRICDILEEHYKTTVVPDSLDYSGFINVLQGVNYFNISRLGKDPAATKKAYDYFVKAASIKNIQYPQALRAKLEGMLNLMITNWMTNKLQTVHEFRLNIREAEEMLQDTTLYKVDKDGISERIKAQLSTADERLLRNVYLADSTVLDKQVADSLMRINVTRISKMKKPSPLTFSRSLLMNVKLGMLSYAQAMEMARKSYLDFKKQLKTIRLSKSAFSSNIQPFLTYFYLNDMADVPKGKKRRNVKEMSDIIVMAFQHREDSQYDNSYVSLLNTIVTYPRAIKYLTADERIYYLNQLNVATQVTTYAHSVHVSMIAETLMQGILDEQPTLLLNTMGYKFVEDIKHDKKQLLEFIHDAAMYHDLGKNSIISVVNNDYRPLTDEEFAIIKRHPELGLQYLELAPSLENFHDTTLGHHKWYNGKGGYPDSFDNTKSPMRTMIDIVTLSDCMQAATERVGRNYKGEKNFETVMAEFRRDAGVKYNPDLVALIDAHPDLAKKLANLINEGWVEIYYNIYSQFIR